jgi:hypothetical protein
MISRLRHDSRGIGAEEEMPVNSRFHSAGVLAVFQYAAAIEPIVQRHFSFRLSDPLMGQRPIGGRHHPFRGIPMKTFSKTLIAAAAFAAIATTAFSQVPWEFNPGMAYMYAGPGKMSAMAMAATPKNHDAMMKNAKKVPANTVFFMEKGQLYSASGMLDPTGNFYLP